ncbi:MAG: hypothetical protein R6X33_12355, partial [Candidatus Brocadiia bacterium]
FKGVIAGNVPKGAGLLCVRSLSLPFVVSAAAGGVVVSSWLVAALLGVLCILCGEDRFAFRAGEG